MSMYYSDGSAFHEITPSLIGADPATTQIGGRNLFIHSGFFTEDSPYSTTSNKTDNYMISFSNKYVFGPIYSSCKFTKGDKIVVSCDSNLPWTGTHGGSATNNNCVGFWLYWYDTLADASKPANEISAVFISPTTTGQTHFSRHITAPRDGYVAFRFNTYSDGTKNVTGKFWNLKLELGDKETGWSIPPEDFRTMYDKLYASKSHKHVMTDISDWGTYIYSATTVRAKNTVLASPNGSDGVASFRTLQIADVSNLQSSLNNKMASRPSNIEFGNTNSTDGGFIDFHYNNSTDDYTSRIIEGSKGVITINGVTLSDGKVNRAKEADNGSEVFVQSAQPTDSRCKLWIKI